MARQRLVDRLAEVAALADELESHVARGMTYARARARIVARDPALGYAQNKKLADAEAQVRQRRLVAGQQAAARTRALNPYRQRMAELQGERRAQDLAATDQTLYDPQSVLGIMPSRVTVDWTDPRTGQPRNSIVYLPLLSGLSIAGIGQAVAAAILVGEGNQGYRGNEAVFHAIIAAFVSQQYSIES